MGLQKGRLVKRFYQRFKPLYTLLLAHIQGVASEAEHKAYASLMLRRLLVLYFLQKQSWFDNDPDYLVRLLQDLQKDRGKDLFYRQGLLPLLQALGGQKRCSTTYRTLSTAFPANRSAEASAMKKGGECCGFIAPLVGECTGNIPQLALPLFQLQQVERDSTQLQIADEAFRQIFALCDNYHWQIDELAKPAEQTVQPDILAMLFEQHIHQKPIGAYYTKDDLVGYCAQFTIIPYLFTALTQQFPTKLGPEASCWELLQRDPERYMHAMLCTKERLPEESEREYTIRRLRYTQLSMLLQQGAIRRIDDFVTYNLNIQQFTQDLLVSWQEPELLLACYNTLERMSVLDPTCGSGAFLLGALAILEQIYACCLNQLQLLADQRPEIMRDTNPPDSSNVAYQRLLQKVAKHPNQRHFILTSIISNNLYGVEIMQEAADICTDRLYLALLATTTRIEDIQPQAAISCHIFAGNALIGPLYNGENAVSGSTGTCSIHTVPMKQTAIIREERETPCPFHWYTAFPGIMKDGGFNVIIGNPPYVEYSKIKQEYTVAGYEEKSCGNLYAAIIERSLLLCQPTQSYLSLIVPLSICGGERFAALRKVIREMTGPLWFANFEIFPCRLFDSAFQRLSIMLAKTERAQQRQALYVTRIHRWYAAERAHLIDLIAYTATQCSIKASMFPKLAAHQQELILQKVQRKSEGKRIANLLVAEKTQYFVYYQEATNYWMKAVCHIPFYKKNGIVMEPQHGRILYFANESTARTMMVLLNSSLFYIWFATFSDGFHLAHGLVKEFPVSKELLRLNELIDLSLRLEQDIQKHARRSTRNTAQHTNQTKAVHSIELEEYHMVHSKPLLDEIDAILAQHYGFSNEELTFIINYDIKYRMGREHMSEVSGIVTMEKRKS